MPPLKAGEKIVIDKIEKTMCEHNMLKAKSVLVALSGGADSVALLHIMHTLSKKYGFKVYSAHVNHCLRGDDALHDEEFSKSVSEKLGVKCFILCADIRKIAEEQGISEELAGRKVRYEFFEKLMDDENIECTATAHHKNDNAETILMNFMRGSSITGLCGIPYKRDKYIRPMLDVTRSEIEEYCHKNSIEFVTDKTNLQTVYTRNKIRNMLIPLLQSDYNPNIVETITKNAQIMASDEDYMDTVVNSEYNRLVHGNSIDIHELNKLHKSIAMRIIRKMTDRVCPIYDITSSVIENIYDISQKDKTGLYADITTDIQARTEYGKLIIAPDTVDCEDFSYILKVGESVYIPQLGYSVNAEYTDKRENDGAQYFTPQSELKEIIIRNRRIGDMFIPSGMNGRKSVKDYMINAKIPKNKRSRIGIVLFGDDIAWIIGHRRDNRFNFYKKGIKIWISY